MTTLESLRKHSSLDKLTKALEKTNKQRNDERYWQPATDKAGNGFAVVRFLPEPPVDGEDGLAIQQLLSAAFEGPGGWYIENSLKTLGQKDPLVEFNNKLWNTKIPANEEQARRQKVKKQYVSNILVVKDPAHPENEGKVFLYKYGVKIFDKIRMAIKPTQAEIDQALVEGVELKPVDVFNLVEGHNFTLRIRKIDGNRNYDTSSFSGLQTPESPVAKGTPIAETVEEITKILNQCYSLKAIVAPDQFKTYAQLEAKLNKVLGLDGGPTAAPKPVKSQPVKEPLPWEEEKTVAKTLPVTDDADAKMLAMFEGLNEED